jgi:16S rRNA (adenine1518-N6/adenine1519-N6)-dimethyltransferase
VTSPPLNIPALLSQHGIRPDRGLGQNFLVKDSWSKKIVEIAEISNNIAVLEVGPGLGSLTRYLAERAQKVVAVELDGRLIPPLEKVINRYKNVHVVEGDILTLDFIKLIDAPFYMVVANIPYYITSALIRQLLEAHQPPIRMVLTLQDEVADRICAIPGRMSLLALSVQVYGRPQKRIGIPASAFYPAPKVDSTVVRVDVYPNPLIPFPNLKMFFLLAKAGFSQKRKTLRNSLAGGMDWSKDESEHLLLSAGIDPDRRAETLSLDEWGLLAERATGKNQN